MSNELAAMPTDEVTLAKMKRKLYERTVFSDDESCWIWVGSLDGPGYGTLSINNVRYKAHRISHHIHTGPIPNGMHVLHHCDQRDCINPSHLFIGTNADNVADKMRKGRAAVMRGEANPASKLTATDVHDIRRLLAAGMKGSAIATIYPVTHGMICRIASGKAWAHVQEETTNGPE